MPRQSPGAEVEGQHGDPSKKPPGGPVEKTKTTVVQTFHTSLLFSSPQWFQTESHIESELNKIDTQVYIKKILQINKKFFMGVKILCYLAHIIYLLQIDAAMAIWLILLRRHKLYLWLWDQFSCAHSLPYFLPWWPQEETGCLKSPQPPLWGTGSKWKESQSLGSPPTSDPGVCTESSSGEVKCKRRRHVN